jgi:predicted SAM-dependent methyltransferase
MASVPDGEMRRLQWGCGRKPVPGWVNSDRQALPGVDICCDIRDGLPVPADHFDYVASMHALQEIPFRELVGVLHELRRVIRTGGVLRLGLPDLDRAIDAYVRGDAGYFVVPDDDAATLAGKLSVQMTWYGSSRSLLTHDFVAELLAKAGFADVRRAEYRRTASAYPEIVSLDNRPRESFFVEATK